MIPRQSLRAPVAVRVLFPFLLPVGVVWTLAGVGAVPVVSVLAGVVTALALMLAAGAAGSRSVRPVLPLAGLLLGLCAVRLLGVGALTSAAGHWLEVVPLVLAFAFLADGRSSSVGLRR